MTDKQFDELAGRIDGVGRVLMQLIADLETRENLDGARFCQGVRRYAANRGRYADLQTSARVMKAIADEVDDARASRAAAQPG